MMDSRIAPKETFLVVWVTQL